MAEWRERAEVAGIPLAWTSAEPDDVLREVYRALQRAGWFVRPVPPPPGPHELRLLDTWGMCAVEVGGRSFKVMVLDDEVVVTGGQDLAQT